MGPRTPSRRSVNIGYHQLVAAARNKIAPVPSGDAALTYQYGAGYVPFLYDSFYSEPVAFRSLADLLLFWEITARSENISGTPYSINGVPTQTAICVKITYPTGDAWILYVAPSVANSGWYYMMNYLNVIPGIKTGPAVNGLKVAKYVAIISGDRTDLDPAIFCSPDMTKLTAL